jgi:hypothetical protein
VSPDGEERDRWVSLGIAPHSPKITRFRQSMTRARRETTVREGLLIVMCHALLLAAAGCCCGSGPRGGRHGRRRSAI